MRATPNFCRTLRGKRRLRGRNDKRRKIIYNHRNDEKQTVFKTPIKVVIRAMGLYGSRNLNLLMNFQLFLMMPADPHLGPALLMTIPTDEAPSLRKIRLLCFMQSPLLSAKQPVLLTHCPLRAALKDFLTLLLLRWDGVMVTPLP